MINYYYDSHSPDRSGMHFKTTCICSTSQTTESVQQNHTLPIKYTIHAVSLAMNIKSTCKIRSYGKINLWCYFLQMH